MEYIMKKVLVLGGGFAGLEAAIDLQKSKMFDVTLVSNRDYFYVYPISIWIPTRKTTFEKVSVPLEDLKKAHNFNVIIDEVQEIKSTSKEVLLKNQTLTYDYLVIAIGAGKMKHKGIENTLSICGEPEMSIAIRDKVDALVAKGSGRIAMGFGGNPKDKSAVRGGPGFELLFNVHDMLKKKKLRENFELTFFAPMEKPGARMGQKPLKNLEYILDRLNIKTRFGKKIKGFDPDKVVFEDDSTLESDLIMFIPASTGHSVTTDLPLNEAGFIKIDDTCLVEGQEHIYAVGDVASLEGPDWKAKQGHIAEVMARNAAYNIIRTEKGKTERKSYTKHLNILCVMDTGNGAAFVYRDDKKEMMFPMPFVGHWMKRGWGYYAKASKLGKIPRIPGM
jgi:sulfide:quinone oxidoreductase